VYKLEHICLRLGAASKLNSVRYVLEALLEPGRVAGVDPKHPCFQGPICGAIAVFDGELRLAMLVLSVSTTVALRASPLTPHRPDPPALSAMRAQIAFRVSHQAAFHDRQSQGRGKREWCRKGLEVSLALL
jgi:hypothetical protein